MAFSTGLSVTSYPFSSKIIFHILDTATFSAQLFIPIEISPFSSVVPLSSSELSFSVVEFASPLQASSNIIYPKIKICNIFLKFFMKQILLVFLVVILVTFSLYKIWFLKSGFKEKGRSLKLQKLTLKVFLQTEKKKSFQYHL